MTTIFDNTTDFVVQTDDRGNVIYVNPAARRTFGFGSDEPVSSFNFAALNTPETNRLFTDAVQLYEGLYCARGEAENRIKEAPLDLFGTHASCHRFAANQLRLLLAALAYTLMQRLRELALKGTELERAAAATIRVRLLKLGAAIVRNTPCARVARLASQTLISNPPINPDTRLVGGLVKCSGSSWAGARAARHRL